MGDRYRIELALFKSGPWTLVQRLTSPRYIPVLCLARTWSCLGDGWWIRVIRNDNEEEASLLVPPLFSGRDHEAFVSNRRPTLEVVRL